MSVHNVCVHSVVREKDDHKHTNRITHEFHGVFVFVSQGVVGVPGPSGPRGKPGPPVCSCECVLCLFRQACMCARHPKCNYLCICWCTCMRDIL